MIIDDKNMKDVLNTYNNFINGYMALTKGYKVKTEETTALVTEKSQMPVQKLFHHLIWLFGSVE